MMISKIRRVAGLGTLLALCSLLASCEPPAVYGSIGYSSYSGGGYYGNGLWGVLIADGQWHEQTADLSILGAAAGGWEGAWGDLSAWEFNDDLYYSFEISVGPTDNTSGSSIYIDDIVFE